MLGGTSSTDAEATIRRLPPMGAGGVGSWRSRDGGRPAGSSGRSAEVPADQFEEAHRYAREVLRFPVGPSTDGLVAAALVRAGGGRWSWRPATVADERLHDAIRHEAWRRQRHPERVRKAHLESRRRFEESTAGPPRWPVRLVLAAVVVILVVLVAAVVVWAAQADPDGPSSTAARSTEPGVVRGRVVVDDSGSDPADLDAIEVELTDDRGTTVARARTDRLGQFTFQAVPPAAYRLELAPPAGLGEAGGSGAGPVAADVVMGPGADIGVTIVLEPV